MSDETDVFDDTDDGGSNLVKDLRKQLEAAKKAEREARAKADEYEAAQRKASVAQLLEAKGARAGLAKFYTADDSSEEAVNAWITENAELLGISVDDTDDETAAQAAAISRASASAPPTKIGSIQDHMSRIAGAKTYAEYEAAVAAASGAR